jgi:hypothetical protein
MPSPSDSNPNPTKKDSFLADDKSRAQFLYWFFGLSPLFARTLSPIIVLMTNLATKKQSNNTVLYNKLVAEASRQFTKGVLGVGSYFGFAELVQSILSKRNKAQGKPDDQSSEATANFWKAITGQISTTAISLFAGGFFVPLENLLAKTEGKGARPLSAWQQNLHHFLDKHLTTNGEPRIWKAAFASTAALAISMTSFSFVVYGLSRAFGHKPVQEAEKKLDKLENKKSSLPPEQVVPAIIQQTAYAPLPMPPTSYLVPLSSPFQNPNQTLLQPLNNNGRNAYYGNPYYSGNPVRV